jgi:drug/metabolite transporter (DMT)-like permease
MYVLATKMTTAANAVLLLYTAPVYVAILAPWWLGEPTRRLDWLFIFLSVGGMCLFFLDRLTASGIWGNFFAIISGVSFGSLAVLLRKQKDASPLDSIILGNVIAALACLPFMEFTLPGSKDGVWLLILGIFQLALPYVLFAEAARRVQALEVILIPMVEPILNPVWVILFYGEIPGFWATIGGVLVLGLVAARAVLAVRLPGR